MTEIHAELAQLNKEANTLMDEIQKAWEELK
jgi:type I restriction enzyme M protein